MSDDRLQQIQTLQFSDKSQAEYLLLLLIREMFPLDVVEVELRPLAVSLNSFNGFMTLVDGTRYFYKTHTEPDSVISEYYNSATLADAGYPVIKPLYSSTEWGKQLLIYEVIEAPSVFDVAWSIEVGESNQLSQLTQAQHRSDADLLAFYRNSLKQQSAVDASQASVHQLFYHRLTGGRLERFYGPLPNRLGEYPSIQLPDGLHSMQAVRQARWKINGQEYTESLDDLMQNAIRLLEPAQSGPSIVGHGDAHNGNVFFLEDEESLLYFDPAFAGQHHPILDLTKPLFHNVFAMWMYFPHVKAQQLSINLKRDRNSWQVEHNYRLHPARSMFFDSKVQRVLLPILLDLKQHNWLRDDWRNYLKAALFCCPFLTMNLTDGKKFPPDVSLLGLTMAVEMGAESSGRRSFIDETLDAVAHQLT